jgi:signal transduction histidine kinase
MNPTWPAIELQDLPPLLPEQATLLDMHSLLNAMNILHGELSLLGLSLADDTEMMKESLAACRAVLAGLGDRASTLRSLSGFNSARSKILDEVQGVLALNPGCQDNPDVAETIANIHSVLVILEVRAREILAREEAPERWVSIPILSLKKNFSEVLQAIEKNSKGRYRILHNLAQKTESDYYVNFAIGSLDGDLIRLPPVFIDVMRDLIANARKYTRPGGAINAGLYEGPHSLRFIVEDTGCGIPEDELNKVVNYGYRASNVATQRSMGGGFGLTKALFVTKQFKGRMWLASQLGEGTRVRIEVPKPATTVS